MQESVQPRIPSSRHDDSQQPSLNTAIIHAELQGKNITDTNIPTNPGVENSTVPLGLGSSPGVSPDFENYEMMQDPLSFVPGYMGLDPFAGFNVTSPNWSGLYPESRSLPNSATSSWDDGTHIPSQNLSMTEFQQTQPDISLRPVSDSENDNESVRSDNDDQEEVIRQISERLGSLQIAEDGELRFFGATSNLNLLSETMDTVHQMSYNETIRARGEARLIATGLNIHVESTLVSHLVDLYCAWQNSSHRVVEKAMYNEKRARYENGIDDSTLYSETLTNAM